MGALHMGRHKKEVPDAEGVRHGRLTLEGESAS